MFGGRTRVPDKKHKVSEGGPRSAMSPEFRMALGVILLLALATVIRDLYILQYRSLPYYRMPALDAEYYDLWAQRVARGEGYGPLPFYMAPLYPYFLALVYSVAGHSLPIMYSVQQALGLVNLVLVYLIGKRLYGHAVGLIAMAMLTLYAPVVYLESKLLTETLGLALNLGALLLVMRAIEDPTQRRFATAGIALGIAALCRPPLLILIVFVAAWMLLRRKSLPGITPAHVGLLILGALLAVSPVTIRNHRKGGGFSLISTNSGIVFAQANNPEATGVSLPIGGFTTDIITQQQEEMHIASAELGHPVSAIEASSYWLHQGLRFIREQPGRFAMLICKKAVWTLHNRESGCSYNVNFEKQLVPTLRFLVMPFAAFVGLGLYGFIRDRRNGRDPNAELLMIQVVAIFAGLIVFSVSSRYRTPAVPALAILSGFGIVQIVQSVRAARVRALVLPAGCIAAACLISLVRYPFPPVTASDPGNLGVAYMAAGDMENAVKYIGRALAMNPASSLAHLNMGVALDRLGNHSGAMEHFREGLRSAPYDGRLHTRLAQDLVRSRRYHEAASESRRALAISPDNIEARMTLAAAYTETGKCREAIREFREVVRRVPETAPAHFSLAILLLREGAYQEAWRETHLSENLGLRLPRSFIKDLSGKMPDPGR